MTELNTASSNGATHRPAMPSKPKPFTDEIKATAVERIKQGEPTWSVAVSLKAHDAQVRDWCKRAGVTPPPPVHDEPFVKAAVARVRGGESVTSVTLSLGIGRATLKKWLLGKPTPKMKQAAVAVLDTKPLKSPAMKALPKAKPGERRKFDEAFKEAIVARIQGGEVSQQVADRLGIAGSVVRRWVLERPHGSKAKGKTAPINKTGSTGGNQPKFVLYPSGRRAFSEDAKREAVARWEAGEPHSILTQELNIGTGQLSAWRKELAGEGRTGADRTKRAYKKRAPLPTPAGAMPMASALAVRDAITYLKHVKTDMYALLATGAIREFEEYHLNVLAALKRLQSVA